MVEIIDWKKLIEDNDPTLRNKIKEEIIMNIKLDKKTEDKTVILLGVDGSITGRVVHSESEIDKLQTPTTLPIAQISPYDVDEWLYYRAWIQNKINENGEIEKSEKEKILNKHINEYLELEANTFIKNALDKLDFVNW